MAHILRLDISNVKGITAVEIEPNGNTIVIGGPNGAGKSSALDSIEMALGGKGHVCTKPLHDGASKGYVIVDTEEWTAKRTFTETNSYIEVTTKEGYKIPRAQEFLDKAVGGPCLDPLEFTRMKPDKQRAVLMEMLGLDFTELDIEARRVAEDRTIIGRERDSLKRQGEAIPLDPAVPKEEISVTALMAQLREAEANNRSNADIRRDVDECAKSVLVAKSDLERARAALKVAESAHAEMERRLSEAKATTECLVDVDTEPISKQIEQADETNAKIREQSKRRTLGQQYKAKHAEYESKSARLQEITKAKEQMIADANFPVAGVTFGEDGIMFNDVPFAQASSAEQLKVATAMALASNPDLRVILIRDGSLLDEQSLAAMSAMAEEHDCQIWLERVSEGEDVSLVIRAGEIAPFVTCDKCLLAESCDKKPQQTREEGMGCFAGKSPETPKQKPTDADAVSSEPEPEMPVELEPSDE